MSLKFRDYRVMIPMSVAAASSLDLQTKNVASFSDFASLTDRVESVMVAVIGGTDGDVFCNGYPLPVSFAVPIPIPGNRLFLDNTSVTARNVMVWIEKKD